MMWCGLCSDRTLPVEVLALIFLEGTHFDRGNDFLLNVSHVSSYWRQTALSTPCLWWDVNISTTWTPRINYDRGIAWIRRSKNSPIRVRSLLRGEWPSISSDQLSTSEVHDVINHLSSSVPRIRSFIMDNRGISISPETIALALKQTSAAIASRGAPLLRDLSVYGSAPVLREPVAITGWPATDLGHLPSLENVLLRYAALIDVPHQQSLTKNLRRFSYKRFTLLDRESDQFTGSRRLSVRHVLEIVAECLSITQMDISDIASDPEALTFRGGGRITNNSLKCAELSFRSAAAMVHFLRRASFPNIRSLSLDADFEATADDARPVILSIPLIDYTLTHLTSLHLSTVCPTVIRSILRRAPNLEALWIDGVDEWPFNYPGPPIEAIIDVLVSPLEDDSENESDSDTTLVAEDEGDKRPHQHLPCPRLKSICMVDCDDLCTGALLRLVAAYAPSPKALISPTIELLSVGLRDEPSPEALDQLKRSVGCLQLDATKWPESDFDSSAYDFTLLPFD